jgi:3'-5' exoribonuclease
VKHLDRIVYKSELPFYPDYIQDEEEEQPRETPKRAETPKPQHKAAEPKTSLGKMLGSYKVEE